MDAALIATEGWARLRCFNNFPVDSELNPGAGGSTDLKGPKPVDEKLADEVGRLAALERYCVLDSAPEEPFERITSLVRLVIGVSISAVSLIDRDRQWFKSIKGLEASEGRRGAAFCARTILGREPMIVTDATQDLRFAENPSVTGDPHIRSYLGVPLRTPDGYNIGSLCASDTVPRQFSEDHIKILENLAALVVHELELRTLAQEDGLTGALSRRGFQEEMGKEVERYRRYGRPTSLILFDIDHFKRINDTHGHPAGDEVLKAVAEGCRSKLRPSDCFGRIGGEEFGIVLPETSEAEALLCAERIREHIAALEPKSNTALKVTASFGVASLSAYTRDRESWVAEADAALYSAKRTGRNRSVSMYRLTEAA